MKRKVDEVDLAVGTFRSAFKAYDSARIAVVTNWNAAAEAELRDTFEQAESTLVAAFGLFIDTIGEATLSDGEQEQS